MKIIFLDFDGVLVNRKSWYVRSGGRATGDPPCVAALNSITDATGAHIVVSSTWRRGTKVIELREILGKWGVKAPVIDKTPILEKITGLVYESPERGEEIQAWLDSYERHPVESFVILDDDSDMGKLANCLVKTEFEVGLTEADAVKAIELLRTAAC